MIDKYNIMADLYEYSTPELVRLLGSRFKEYRMRCNLTQKEVADQSGIGLTTIHKFENGSAGNLSLSTFILLLKVVGQNGSNKTPMSPSGIPAPVSDIVIIRNDF